MSTGEIKLDTVLQDLHRTTARLISEFDHASSKFVARLEALEATIESLGKAKPSKRLRCPSEYLIEWQQVSRGENIELSSRVLRYLCWQAEISAHRDFHKYLRERKIEIGARSMQGLIWSYHTRWSDSDTQEWLVTILREGLHAYRGPNRMLAKWRQSIHLIIGRTAPNALAMWIKESTYSPKKAAAEWGIDEQSAFFLETMKSLLRVIRPGMGRNNELCLFMLNELLAWPNWTLDDYKTEIANTIMHRDSSDAKVHEPLTAFVLSDSRLGDPRLPSRNSNWLGMRPEAKKKMIEWLSKADIIFFFEHAFPRGADRHFRKPFWLDYVGCIAMSRPLLSRQDLAKLRSHERRTQTQVGRYGIISGNNSAFILDFGELVAVEFSQVGAVYVYDRRNAQYVISDLFKDEPFTEDELKDKHRCIDRIRHVNGWEHDMRNLLATYGIRPNRP